jgi:hypothetical protein
MQNYLQDGCRGQMQCTEGKILEKSSLKKVPAGIDAAGHLGSTGHSKQLAHTMGTGNY